MVARLVLCTFHLMPNNYFQFKQFTIQQDRCAMKVTTDGCLFGSWIAERVGSREFGVRSSESGVNSMKMDVNRILDIGAGTGLLSLMLAQKTNSFIEGIEIDKDAFEQARENINSSPWKESVRIYDADAMNFSSAIKYEVIISNPPFYENELKSDNAKKNLAQHSGLTIQQLLKVIKQNLSNDGSFFLLLPYKRNKEIESLIGESSLSITQKTFVRQSTNHDYFRVMIEGNHKQAVETAITNEIAIWNNQQQYTSEFIRLLKDYYLHL